MAALPPCHLPWVLPPLGAPNNSGKTWGLRFPPPAWAVRWVFDDSVTTRRPSRKLAALPPRSLPWFFCRSALQTTPATLGGSAPPRRHGPCSGSSWRWSLRGRPCLGPCPIRDSRLCRLRSNGFSLNNHVPLDDGTHLITMKPTGFYSRVNT